MYRNIYVKINEPNNRCCSHYKLLYEKYINKIIYSHRFLLSYTNMV